MRCVLERLYGTQIIYFMGAQINRGRANIPVLTRNVDFRNVLRSVLSGPLHENEETDRRRPLCGEVFSSPSGAGGGGEQDTLSSEQDAPSREQDALKREEDALTALRGISRLQSPSAKVNSRTNPSTYYPY